MYMSYCRFEGTRSELNACLADVEEHAYEEAEYEVSDREINHFRQMVEHFYGWMVDMGLIDFNGELDRETLNDICEKMGKSYAEDPEEV